MSLISFARNAWSCEAAEKYFFQELSKYKKKYFASSLFKHFRNYICSTGPFLTKYEAMFLLRTEKDARNLTTLIHGGRWADWNRVGNHAACLPHSHSTSRLHTSNIVQISYLQNSRNKSVSLELATAYSCRLCHRGRICGYIAMLSYGNVDDVPDTSTYKLRSL